MSIIIIVFNFQAHTHFVNSMLTLHGKYSKLFAEVFDGAQAFIGALDKVRQLIWIHTLCITVQLSQMECMFNNVRLVEISYCYTSFVELYIHTYIWPLWLKHLALCCVCYSDILNVMSLCPVIMLTTLSFKPELTTTPPQADCTEKSATAKNVFLIDAAKQKGSKRRMEYLS